MSTDNRANHPNRFKRMATPDRDPNYPPMDYYEREERNAQARRRLNEDLELELDQQARNQRAENDGRGK